MIKCIIFWWIWWHLEENWDDICLQMREVRIMEEKGIGFVVAGIIRRDTKNIRYREGILFPFLFLSFPHEWWCDAGWWPGWIPTVHVALGMELSATIESQREEARVKGWDSGGKPESFPKNFLSVRPCEYRREIEKLKVQRLKLKDWVIDRAWGEEGQRESNGSGGKESSFEQRNEPEKVKLGLCKNTSPDLGWPPVEDSR